MCHNLIINNDAIFIADSHSQDKRDRLLLKLSELTQIPSQIFLLGDISNLLIGGIKRSVEYNKHLLDCINNLSHKSQIIYFEGNHDFDLAPILPNVIKIPRKIQPIIAIYDNKNILLSHGDLFLDKKYETYIRALTSKTILNFLKAFNIMTFGKLYEFIHKKVENKKINFPKNINNIIDNRLNKYKNYIKLKNLKIDMVVEGHFHIGKISNNEDFTYVALPSFCFDERIFNIEKNHFETLKS